MNTEEKENIEHSVVEKKKKKKSGKLVLIILIIAISVICLCVGGYFLLFNEKTNNIENNQKNNDVTDKENVTKDDHTKVSGFKYALIEFNNDIYEFKVMKNSQTSDSITSYDINDDKEIKYNYEINDGNVVITNVTDNNTYTIKSIMNAKELIAADMGQSPEVDGLFVLTNDGKVYSISLYNTASTDGIYKLIRNCSDFENTIQSYDVSATSISQGSYYPKNTAGGEGAILITNSNNKQYVIKTYN